MDELIKKYTKEIRKLYKEYHQHLGEDAIKTYIYGKILTYQRVIRDLKSLKGMDKDELFEHQKNQNYMERGKETPDET